MHSIWLVLVLSVLSSSVSAGTLGHLTYEIANGKVTITYCMPSAQGELTIPSKIEGRPVTSIGEESFYGTKLTSITIPYGVKSIGGGAFSNCYDLSSINIPESVTSISWSVFGNCRSLTSIIIPNSVTSIGGTPFYGCDSLTSITIPQAFHNQAQATRLSLTKLWPDRFFLPSNETNPPAKNPAQISLRMVPAITVTGDVGQTSIIEVADTAAGPWSEWRTVIIGDDGTTEVDLDEGAEKRFYRVMD